MGEAERARILGVDPGSRAAGYGVVEVIGQSTKVLDCGVIRVSGDLPLHRRLAVLHSELAAVVARYEPTELAIEQVFTARNARSALVLGHARGVLLLAAGDGCEVYEYAARAVKKAVAGYGQADKNQVARMVTALLGLSKTPAQDASDALAIALCHAQCRRMQRRLQAAETLQGTRA